MNEYNNDADFDGLWGIWDEKFLEFYADKMNTFKEPFFSSFFSVSSHHPFKVPPDYEDKFKGGPLVIHKCIQYTDYGLRKFFAKVSKMPCYKNTIFVTTADHTSSEIGFPEGRTAWGLYHIPIIFFAADNSLRGVEPGIGQQIDILPTTLGLLHYDEPFLAFGSNLFGDTEPFCFNYKDNAYQLFGDKYLLQFDGTKSLALYDFKSDVLLKKNLVTELPEVVAKMEKKIKAIIQQYNNRMIEDRLTVR
jgi:phosphoglycerol transferase MdoB-like AlkP superfamily enzyme